MTMKLSITVTILADYGTFQLAVFSTTLSSGMRIRSRWCDGSFHDVGINSLAYSIPVAAAVAVVFVATSNHRDITIP